MALVYQGRGSAPPLTHLRGNAAIVSSRNAASLRAVRYEPEAQLKFGTPRAWRALPEITNTGQACAAMRVISTGYLPYFPLPLFRPSLLPKPLVLQLGSLFL